MSKLFTHQLTFEDTDSEGIIRTTSDVRISFNFFPFQPGYFNPDTGVGWSESPAKIEWVSTKVQSVGGAWIEASETISAWADSLIETKSEIFFEFVQRETESWHD